MVGHSGRIVRSSDSEGLFWEQRPLPHAAGQSEAEDNR